VLSFEAEIQQLRPRIGDVAADTLIARERREVFSLYPEVRIAAWGGALLIATAVGIFVKKNFEQLDARAIAVVLAIAAAACYAWAARRPRTVVSDYIVLLGALILSADVGFVEQQFDVFGAAGIRHFLILAVVHGITAYVFDSRLVLSLSIGALAAWMGLEKRSAFAFDAELAVRAFVCAAVVLGWRFVNRRPQFARVFEHFAANLALWGGLALIDKSELLAAIVTTSIAAVVIWWAYRTGVESFLLYGFVYAFIAIAAAALKWWSGDDLLVMLIAIVVAVPCLVILHRSFARREA
jgi:hypothetical protein